MNESSNTNSENKEIAVISEIEFEKLKLVYEKAVESHKYFLSWRQFLLTGFFAVESILFLSCYKIYSESTIKYFSILIALLIPITSVLFFLFENRNRVLYQSCQKTAVEIEKKLFGSQLDSSKKNTIGLFFDLDKSSKSEELNIKKSMPTHSETMQGLFMFTGFIGILVVFFLLFELDLLCICK